MDCAMEEVDDAIAQRETHGEAGGSYEDVLTSKIDCIINFVDDLFDKKTFETLALCYNLTLDTIWESTNEEVNNDKVNHMNAIKVELAPLLERVRTHIRDRYPNSGESAIYKKCLKCNAVYTRPTGCDYLGR